MVSLSELRLRAVRARIADVASVTWEPAMLGGIRLRPQQQLAAARVTQMIAQHGGSLLAEDVGRGKTYVALAVARRWERPLAVVPASLRTTWQRAMERAQVPCAMITHEALSRGSRPSFEPDGVVVDESHRFRSPEAARHAALAAVTAHASVLLLSATPLQNRARDLAAQLAFFLGSSAFLRSEAALARFVVRSAAAADLAELPQVVPPRWLHTGHDDGQVLHAILALPPPARSLDTGDAGALRIIGLVRAWASSRAALAGALRRRTRVMTALEQCAASGLSPSRRDLGAWQGLDGAVQLALAPLLVPAARDDEAGVLVDAVGHERSGLDRLRAALRDSADPDAARVDALRRLRREHPGTRVLAFSEFAATVRAYFALLRADGGVGMLTAQEARIASGPLPRDALLDHFAPAARGARDPVPRERVTLLLATDLLSEGVNLQDASIVVHLDLPWNPARLAQRLGRVRRPGGATQVHSYLISPPATTELLLRLENRLRAKLARAERTIGRTLDVLPLSTASPEALTAALTSRRLDDTAAGASAESLGAVADRVAEWRRTRARPLPGRTPAPLAAAASSGHSGWLAALDDGRLLARAGASPADTVSAVARAVEAASGPARALGASERARALAESSGWLDREALALDCGVHEMAPALDTAIERRIARALARAPRHERVRMLRLANRLRDQLGYARPLGVERELERLLATHADTARCDVEWLERSVSATERLPARRARSARPRVVALIVFGPASSVE